MSDPIVLTTNSIPVQWIPEDITGELSTNFFKEMHPVSECTSHSGVGNTVIISPYRGAFYASEDFTVQYAYRDSTSNEIATTLSRADYRFVGLDIGRTRASSSKYGVYRFIQFTYDTSGISDNGYFYITYHAFGGEIDRYAYSRLVEMIDNIVLTGGSGSGSSGGGSSSGDVTALTATVEEIARRINYNPSTSVAVNRATDAGWKTIACSSADLDAYIDFDKPETLAGVGKFVIVSPYIHGTYNIAYDIYKVGSSYKCLLSCDTTDQKIFGLDPENSAYFGTYGNPSTPGIMTIPFFRMIVEKGALGTGEHRLLLQIALRSDASQTNYSLFISDKTDVVSTLSAGVQTSQSFDAWEVGDASLGNNYIISNEVIGLQNYYKIWQGNASLKFIEDVSWSDMSITRQYNVQNVLVPTTTSKGYIVWPFVKARLEAKAIRSIQVDIYDRWQRKLRRVSSEATMHDPYGGNTSFVYANINYFPIDSCTLEMLLFYDSMNRTMIKLYASSGKNSYVNDRFDLKAIYIK